MMQATDSNDSLVDREARVANGLELTSTVSAGSRSTLLQKESDTGDKLE